MPEAALSGAGFGFGGGIRGGFVVAFVVPGETGAEHFKIRVAPVGKHLADCASVLVDVVNLHGDIATGDQRCEMLPRRLAERLRFLRRVDPVEPYPVLAVPRV